MQYDIFNGDADGLCALMQLRLANPCQNQLITGIKRDIQLLKKCDAKQANITVLDISIDKNRADVYRLLQQQNKIFYCDHHYAGEIPQHENLQTLIDTSPTTCTSLIVNDYLNGRFALWAMVGAFGDNFYLSANTLAEKFSLSRQQLEQLAHLGTCLNYNGYGTCIEDLYFPPDELFRIIQPYENPLDFLQDKAYQHLDYGYQQDMVLANKLTATIQHPHNAVYVMPDEAWTKRVNGVLGNQLAREHKSMAFALLTHHSEGGFQVSVRAPKNNPHDADTLCRTFPTGGGRKAAAGINHLPSSQFDAFVTLFQETYA